MRRDTFLSGLVREADRVPCSGLRQRPERRRAGVVVAVHDQPGPTSAGHPAGVAVGPRGGGLSRETGEGEYERLGPEGSAAGDIPVAVVTRAARKKAPFTAPPLLDSTPAPAGRSTDRRYSPAPPGSGRSPFLLRRHHTGRGPPSPAQTSGGRGPPGAAAPSLAALPFEGSRSRGTPRRRPVSRRMSAAAPQTRARVHPLPPGGRWSRGGSPEHSFAHLHQFAHLCTQLCTAKNSLMPAVPGSDATPRE